MDKNTGRVILQVINRTNATLAARAAYYNKTPRGRLYRRLFQITALALAALLIVCIISIQANWNDCIEYRDAARSSPFGVPAWVILDDGRIVPPQEPTLIEYKYLAAVVVLSALYIAVDVSRTRDRRKYAERFLESTEKTNGTAGE